MIVSSIKNRIRFVDANIKNQDTADKIEKSLKNLEGVESIRINKVIGSLLINYNEEKTSEIELINSLKEYIDISEQSIEERNKDINSFKASSYLDKISSVFRKSLRMKRYKWGRSI